MEKNMKSYRNKYGNKKVVTSDNKFDSKLEKYLFDKLTLLKIPIEFQVKYVLIPKFKFNGENIREMAMIIDFKIEVNGLVIWADTKGFETTDSKLKYKMLRWFEKEKPNVRVIWLHNETEVNEFLINITDNYVNNQQSYITW
jgi:hypothetical protein